MRSPELVPLWFQRGLVIVTAGVICLGGVGLLLAVVGIYHFYIAVVVGGLATVALTAIAWPRPEVAIRRCGPVPGRPSECASSPAGSLAWNAHYAGHHVAIGRDPGV